MARAEFLCGYTQHCAPDCACCDFEACDCHSVCPSDCACSHDWQWSRHVVQCARANRSTTHSLLPATVTELNYEENYLDEFKPLVLIGKSSLLKLNLARNNLRELTNDTFCAAVNLREINLSQNPPLVTVISSLNEIFGCLKHLQTIVLSRDQFESDEDVSDGWFIDADHRDTAIIRVRRIAMQSPAGQSTYQRAGPGEDHLCSSRLLSHLC